MEVMGMMVSMQGCRAFVLALVGCCLAGCATTPDTNNDPRYGGFVGGLMGEMRGDYDKRVDLQKQRLQGLESRLDRLSAENREKNQDVRMLATQVEQLRGAVHSVKGRLTAIRAKISRIETKKGGLVGERLSLKNDLNRVKEEIAQVEHGLQGVRGQGDVDEQQVLQMEKDLQNAQEEYELLRQRLRIRMGAE